MENQGVTRHVYCLFHRDTNIKKIYKIKAICRATVTVESITSDKLIPQCKTLQSFGHTKNYCNKPPRCVTCAGLHLTSKCIKPNSAQPKCCHCGKNHPANYRSCEAIKELQKLRDNKNKPKQQVRTNKIVRIATQIMNLKPSKSSENLQNY
jgi:hypothetical protein